MSSDPPAPRFLFVGGVERSGTSLVQRLLTAHSEVAGGPELQFTGQIADLHNRMSWIARSGPDPYRRRLLSFVTPEELDQSFRDFFRSFRLNCRWTAGHPDGNDHDGANQQDDDERCTKCTTDDGIIRNGLGLVH